MLLIQLKMWIEVKEKLTNKKQTKGKSLVPVPLLFSSSSQISLGYKAERYRNRHSLPTEYNGIGQAVAGQSDNILTPI